MVIIGLLLINHLCMCINSIGIQMIFTRQDGAENIMAIQYVLFVVQIVNSED